MWFIKWCDVVWQDGVLWDVTWWDVMYRDVMGPEVIWITEPCGFDGKHDRSDYGEPMYQHRNSILLNTLRGTQQYYDVQNVTPFAVFPLLNWRHRDLSIFFVVQTKYHDHNSRYLYHKAKFGLEAVQLLDRWIVHGTRSQSETKMVRIQEDTCWEQGTECWSCQSHKIRRKMLPQQWLRAAKWENFNAFET